MLLLVKAVTSDGSRIAAFVSYISKLVFTDTLGVAAATKKIFNNWGDLFKRQAFDGDDQVDRFASK